MLGDVIKHLTPDRAFEEYYGKLHAIMIKLLANIEDFPSLFAMVFEREKKQLTNNFLFCYRIKCCHFLIYFNVKMFE